MLLTDIQVDQVLRGVEPDRPVRVVQARPQGSQAINLTYEDLNGENVQRKLVYDEDAEQIEVVGEEHAGGWTFEGDAAAFRLAHLFDPMMAVHSSQVEPLPPQLTAVQGTMQDGHGHEARRACPPVSDSPYAGQRRWPHTTALSQPARSPLARLLAKLNRPGTNDHSARDLAESIAEFCREHDEAEWAEVLSAALTWPWPRRRLVMLLDSLVGFEVQTTSRVLRTTLVGMLFHAERTVFLSSLYGLLHGAGLTRAEALELRTKIPETRLALFDACWSRLEDEGTLPAE